MINPLDLERLAVRIETLQRQRQSGWSNPSILDFRQHMPGGRGRPEQVLPDPAELRQMSRDIQTKTQDPADMKRVKRLWNFWTTLAMRLEGVVRDEDPRNPKKIVRDMARGKFPHGYR